MQAGGVQIIDNLSFTINKGEQWALVGSSGSGKTVLAHTLTGRHFYSGQMSYNSAKTSERVTIVEQLHRFRNRPGTTELYYQQRFNASDADQTMTVEQELAGYAGWGKKRIVDKGWKTGSDERADDGRGGKGAVDGEGVAGRGSEKPSGEDKEARNGDRHGVAGKGEKPGDDDEAAGNSEKPGDEQGWLDSLHIRPLLSRPLIQLSNGENKRVQLAIALLEEPELLILDNPFLGLDTEGRTVLHSIINSLAAKGMQLLLITHAGELPEAITHVAQLEKGRLVFAGPKNEFHPQNVSGPRVELDPDVLQELQDLSATEPTFSVAVKMVDVTISYGEKVILQDINWVVKKGERWNLSGPNGAGKSTLLSLITGDNPQAYANAIWLFDRRRGSGETIWEIKQMIGYVSPELHLYFEPSATCFEVIASGLFDTIGLFRRLSPAQEQQVLLWMQLLALDPLRHKRLAQLSTGQQRMVLLARALIKNPPMLILDEPCQGLDDQQTQYFRALISLLCEAFAKTLIYVSHYRQEIPDVVNQFLRLEHGRMVE